jgi:hypothetical protein
MEQREYERRREARGGRLYRRLDALGVFPPPEDEMEYKRELHACADLLDRQGYDPLPATRTTPITAAEIRGRCDSARTTLVDLHPWGADPDGENDIPF